MKLSLSNIAWDPSEDAAVADLLLQHHIHAIDVAPGKYFADPQCATSADIDAVRNAWKARGIDIIGMQALLFGTSGLNLFADSATQSAMLTHLSAVCRIGAGLGARYLVFGSPKNRDCHGWPTDEVLPTAVDFFCRLGDTAAGYGVCICLEPNPTCYGANFMTTAAETAKIVHAVNHPMIKMQLDSGALTINSESALDVLTQHHTLIGHIHASERDLLPLGDSDTCHAEVAAAIRHYLPHATVTIEMRATTDEPHLQSIERALRQARQAYGDDATPNNAHATAPL